GPALIRGRLRRQLDRGAGRRTDGCCQEIVNQEAQRYTVDDQVVGGEQEAGRFASPQAEERDAQQGAVLEVEAPLDLRGGLLEGPAPPGLGQGREIHAKE